MFLGRSKVMVACPFRPTGQGCRDRVTHRADYARYSNSACQTPRSARCHGAVSAPAAIKPKVLWSAPLTLRPAGTSLFSLPEGAAARAARQACPNGSPARHLLTRARSVCA